MRAAASWGGLRLYTLQTETDGGSNVTVHEPSSGNDFVVQNRGRRLAVVRMELVFCDVVGESKGYEERFAEFQRLRDTGKPQLFVHPLLGSYRAELGECKIITDPGDEIRASAEFVPSEAIAPVFDVGAGFAPIAGPEAVAAAAGRADDELAEIDLEPDALADAEAVTASAAETSTGWVEDDADSRTVYLELATEVAAIDALIAELELSSDYGRWQAYMEMIALRTALLDAADAQTSTAARVAVVVTEVAMPLIAICAREYGASQAAERAEEVARRNDLRDQLLVPAGTRLEMPIAGRRG